MRILVATGGAAHSFAALTFGAHLAKASQATLIVLTVVKRNSEMKQAEAILERTRPLLNPLGIEFETLVRIGHPAEEILEEAERGKYGLVVVGEKQHHSFKTRFILGSTALRVVEHAPCPAVIVKGQIGAIEKILICDSGASNVSVVDKMAAQIPHVLDGAKTITVLHVMSQISALPNLESPELAADTDTLLEERDAPEGRILRHDRAVLARTGHESAPKVRHGRVVDEILAEAHEGSYDLVVIGAHQGTGWRQILLDDIAHQIIVELDRPVLIVR